MLLPALSISATAPATLRVVDLRGITGQPELETWLGSLQGAVNRRDGETVVYLVRNNADAELANAFVAMYHLQKETFTPGALLAAMKPTLTGQVLYNPAQPWTRNIALTAAAVADGLVVVTETDLGVRTVLDLRNRWTDRRDAYAWATQEFGEKVDQTVFALAPESGHLFADLIVSRKLLAVDLALNDAAEKTALEKLIQRLPDGGRLLGSLDDRNGKDAEITLWSLTLLLGDRDRTIVPVRNSSNLSCLARFPLTRPLLQGRYEAPASEETRNVTLIYDGGRALDGSQSLDFATQILPGLLGDPALASLPVGIETPATLKEFAPGLYQLLLARQRSTAAELFAAPNGDGWALPMAMRDARSYLQRGAQSAAALDLTGQALFDVGGKAAFIKCLEGLAAQGMRGAFAYPLATDALADKQVRESYVVSTQFTGLVGVSHVRTAAELRSTLSRVKGPFTVIYLDPFTLPPAVLRSYLPELNKDYVLMTPSQMLRTISEYIKLMPWLQAKAQRGITKPTRDKATLKVAAPVTSEAAPTAAKPIPISVQVTGAAQVLVARLIYTTPRGRICAADLQSAGNGLWKAVLPPTLVGGTLTVSARFVESAGFGVTFSNPLTLEIPVVDTDEDGMEDTAEEYLGADPATADTDHDGLADGYDADPLHANRETAVLMPTIFPPADKPWLTDAGPSTADEKGRHIPAGGAITYRLSLQDIPRAPGALHLLASGPGTVALNTDAPAVLETHEDTVAMTEVPVSAVQMRGKELQVTVKAGEKPLTIMSLTLLNNPKGPHILPISLSPATPPADTPIFATAIVYTTKRLKAVRLRYGVDLNNLTTLDMGHLEGTAGAVFAETIPGQRSGTILLYGIEAEDVDGNISAGPFQAVPVGRTRKPTFALVGSRDIRGKWNATPIWRGYGRSSVKGAGADTAQLSVRSGKNHAWLLAQPIERGIEVNLFHKPSLATRGITFIKKTLPAGSPSGWYYLGSFDAKESIEADLTIAPVGEAGYCAYGMLVVTQDDLFKPPLAHVGLDWFNTLTITGIENNEEVGNTIALRVLPTGNIDGIRVTARQVTSRNGIYIDDRELQRQLDGQYMVSTRGLPPGNYDIIAEGLKTLKSDGKTHHIPIVSVTVHVTVPK